MLNEKERKERDGIPVPDGQWQRQQWRQWTGSLSSLTNQATVNRMAKNKSFLLTISPTTPTVFESMQKKDGPLKQE